jgi:hypothetical protein
MTRPRQLSATAWKAVHDRADVLPSVPVPVAVQVADPGASARHQIGERHQDGRNGFPLGELTDAPRKRACNSLDCRLRAPAAAAVA